MKSFNKTEAAVFRCRLCFLGGGGGLSLFSVQLNKKQQRQGYFIDVQLFLPIQCTTDLLFGATFSALSIDIMRNVGKCFLNSITNVGGLLCRRSVFPIASGIPNWITHNSAFSKPFPEKHCQLKPQLRQMHQHVSVTDLRPTWIRTGSGGRPNHTYIYAQTWGWTMSLIGRHVLYKCTVPQNFNRLPFLYVSVVRVIRFITNRK